MSFISGLPQHECALHNRPTPRTRRTEQLPGSSRLLSDFSGRLVWARCDAPNRRLLIGVTLVYPRRMQEGSRLFINGGRAPGLIQDTKRNDANVGELYHQLDGRQ